MTETSEDVGYILGSDYRTETVTALEESKKQPSEIAEKTGIKISHVSRALNQLSERGLVEVLNPEAKKGRLYALTDDGQEVLEDLDTQNDTTDVDTSGNTKSEPRSGVFIEIDEKDSIVDLQLKALDEAGNEFIAGEVIPEPGRYELRKVSDDPESRK